MTVSHKVTQNDSVLYLGNVYKSYGSKVVLDGVNLTLKKGSIMGLLGENGAGKTTLLKTALGLLKADKGEVSIFSEDAWNMPSNCKQRLGYVAQSLDSFHWMSAQELFTYTGAFFNGWDVVKVEQLANTMGLDTTQRISRLSIGQQQQVAILQALGHSPELLVLDEPVASLDPSARRSFIKELIDINLEAQTSILFSTHITSDVERAAADIAILKSGKVAYQGSIDELKEQIVQLRIESQHDLPDLRSDKDVIRQKLEGKFGRITVKGFDRRGLDAWEKALNAKVVVEPMNLEEIFLEING